jgi:hypothetical protein
MLKAQKPNIKDESKQKSISKKEMSNKKTKLV